MTSKSKQEDLFNISPANDLQYKVKELDNMILESLKNNDYQRAKSLTDLQKRYIQELVNLGDNNT